MILKRYYTKIKDRYDGWRLRRFLLKSIVDRFNKCYENGTFLMSVSWSDPDVDNKFWCNHVFHHMNILDCVQVTEQFFKFFYKEAKMAEETGQRQYTTHKGKEIMMTVPMEIKKEDE